MSTKFKVESGMQLLARLTKKPCIENFYPNLFRSGPKPGHTIEMYSDDDLSILLNDIICESLMPLEFGGKDAGVVVLNTDGKFDFDYFVKLLQKKIKSRATDEFFKNYFQDVLGNLFIFDIFNASQFNATIHSLDTFLINHPNVSLVIFNTLTAFYWSEQNFKIVKMDSYIKVLLKLIQNVLKDYKVVILYTRPQYFSSSKENIKTLEACYENPSLEQLNYRIQVIYTDDGIHCAKIRTFNQYFKSMFRLYNDDLIWL